VKEAKPAHYVQCQLGMHALGLTRALYLVVNKDDETLYQERLEYDAAYCAKMLARAEAHHQRNACTAANIREVRLLSLQHVQALGGLPHQQLPARDVPKLHSFDAGNGRRRAMDMRAVGQAVVHR
jgi:hypothetical protein